MAVLLCAFLHTPHPFIEGGNVLTEEEADAHLEKLFANLATESRQKTGEKPRFPEQSKQPPRHYAVDRFNNWKFVVLVPVLESS